MKQQPNSRQQAKICMRCLYRQELYIFGLLLDPVKWVLMSTIHCASDYVKNIPHQGKECPSVYFKQFGFKSTNLVGTWSQSSGTFLFGVKIYMHFNCVYRPLNSSPVFKLSAFSGRLVPIIH